MKSKDASSIIPSAFKKLLNLQKKMESTLENDNHVFLLRSYLNICFPLNIPEVVKNKQQQISQQNKRTRHWHFPIKIHWEMGATQ